MATLNTLYCWQQRVVHQYKGNESIKETWSIHFYRNRIGHSPLTVIWAPWLLSGYGFACRQNHNPVPKLSSSSRSSPSQSLHFLLVFIINTTPSSPTHCHCGGHVSIPSEGTCGICGRKGSIGTSFSPSTAIFPSRYHSPVLHAHISFIYHWCYVILALDNDVK